VMFFSKEYWDSMPSIEEDDEDTAVYKEKCPYCGHLLPQYEVCACEEEG